MPEDDAIGGWRHRLIAWWIDADTGYPIHERSGVIRWFVRVQDELYWADSRDELLTRFASLPPEGLVQVRLHPDPLEDYCGLSPLAVLARGATSTTRRPTPRGRSSSTAGPRRDAWERRDVGDAAEGV